MLSKFKINSLKWQFYQELERDFLDNYFQKSLIPFRLALILGVLVYIFFGILDAWIAPEIKFKLWLIRYVLVCPFGVSLIVLTFFPAFKQFMQPAIALLVIVVGGGTIAIQMVATPALSYIHYAGLVLILMYSYTSLKLRFIYATIANWTVVIIYNIVNLILNHNSLAILLTENFILVGANLLGMFASYNLEYYLRKDFLQTRQLQAEQKKSEQLLLNILPETIANRLKQERNTIAESFEEVTVLFADIAGFTQLASRLEPTELVSLLNQIFSEFDQLAECHGLEKIKTIGDAYMVVGGLPNPKQDHAIAIAEMALDMQKAIAQFNLKTGESFKIRIGINTGHVVAGVIGIKKFIYDLWGDTVNIASRMESHGVPGCIQVTAATYELLRHKYQFEQRGEIQVKGKGQIHTYLLIGRDTSATDTRILDVNKIIDNS